MQWEKNRNILRNNILKITDQHVEIKEVLIQVSMCCWSAPMRGEQERGGASLLASAHCCALQGLLHARIRSLQTVATQQVCPQQKCACVLPEGVKADHRVDTQSENVRDHSLRVFFFFFIILEAFLLEHFKCIIFYAENMDKIKLFIVALLLVVTK